MNDDLISREALIKELQSAKYLCYDNNSISRIQNHEIDRCISFVEDAPTVEERPTGEWILHGMIYYCSNCGHDCGESGDNFCGNCGAKMKGEEE